MTQFTIGSDVEFMLQRNGQLVSAIGIVPGSKEERYRIGKHEFYYDNVLAECAIQYAKTKPEFVSNIRDCLSKFATLVKPNTLILCGAANYPVAQLKHPDAKKIGCDPELCCYALIDIKPDEEAFAKQTMRTAGGHIHIGHKTAKDQYGIYQIVRMLDLFLGVPSIFLDHDPTAKLRKKWYGKAGRFRRPPHGVEYRSLSNFWFNSPKMVELVYDICDFVLEYVEKGKDTNLWDIDKEALDGDEVWGYDDFDAANYHHCTGYNLKAMRKAIDTMDKALGLTFMDFIKEQMPSNLYKQIEVLANESRPYNLYKEWKLN